MARRIRDLMVGGEGRSPMPFSLRNELDKFFDNMATNWGFEPFWSERESSFSPSINISEDGNSITVSAEIPGMGPDDVEIILQNGTLSIRGEKRDEIKKEEENRYHSERMFGSFCRTISLAREIKEDEVNAEFKNGVLTIKLPKSEKDRSAVKKVPIKSA